MSTPLILWQMPARAEYPNPSPFCVKLETWLRMAEVPYRSRALKAVPKSTSAKVPYVEFEDGRILEDTARIIRVLSDERGVDPDRHLDEHQRALGILIRRTIEESLYFLVLHARWVSDEGWAETEPWYFGQAPWAIRKMLAPRLRKQVAGYAHGQGVSRLPDGERERRVVEDVSALAVTLGDQPFFLGEQPTHTDAGAYAFLAHARWAPAVGTARDEIRRHPNLMDFVERMRSRYFAEWTPPD